MSRRLNYTHATMFVAFLLIASNRSVIVADEPAIEGSSNSVEATFDPNGPFDNDGLVKDPIGGAEPIPEPEEAGDPRGGPVPANNTCSSATVIPGNIVTYNPADYDTTGATVSSCDGAETCEVGNAGVSNTVWYVYTPDISGTIEIDTFGSNYNTVLSVFTNSCGFAIGGPCINVPTQLACNDDYLIGTLSLINMEVTAGVTYRIKVGDYNTTDGGGVLDFNLKWFPANDSCVNATVIPGIHYDPPTYNTANALTDTCEAEETCELNNVGTSNSVWYTYSPACDGFLNINTNGSSYDTVLSVWDKCGEFVAVDFPCDYPVAHPVELACDDDSGTGTNSQLSSVPVDAGEIYLIKVADYNGTSGGGNLNFNFMFVGADDPIAVITSPGALACVCGGNVSVIGSASAGVGPVTWELESQPAGGGSWTSISSGVAPVANAALGTWNTTALTQGYHNLRLSVRNSCGMTNTAVQTVYIDQAFDSIDIREPDDGDIVGGRTCFDGTIWDNCFSRYSVTYRPAGGGVFNPVEPGVPTYAVPVTNDPLVANGWDTTSLADGNYELSVDAADVCGHEVNATRLVTVDNTLPTAVITSPLSCTSSDTNMLVTGTANDAHLAGWVLQYTGGNAHTWVTIASGNTPVVNGTLGTWNTAGLPACAYTLRLIATDAAVLSCGPSRNQTEYTVSVNLGAPAGGLCCDVNGDGLGDGADVQPFVQCLLNGICP